MFVRIMFFDKFNVTLLIIVIIMIVQIYLFYLKNNGESLLKNPLSYKNNFNLYNHIPRLLASGNAYFD